MRVHNSFILFGLLFFTLDVNSAPFEPPILDRRVVAFPVDLDQDGQVDFQLSANAVPLGGFPGTEITNNRVGFALEILDLSRILRATSGRIYFRTGEQISSVNTLFIYPSGGQNLVVGGYDEYKIPGMDWTYFDIYKDDQNNFWKSLTEMLIGVRTAQDDGFHYGWIKFWRPNTTFTTPFEMIEFAWNPLPGEPIAAGRPPAIPLQPEITPEGLKVRWPAVLTTWILEYSASLGSDAEWVAVPEAGNGEILLPLPETTRFYRLRSP